MAELCLMASQSHGYLPGLFFHPPEQGGMPKFCKDYHPLLSNPGLSQDSWQRCLYKPTLHLTEDPLKPSISTLDSNELFRNDLTTRRSVLIDVQDFRSNSLLLSFGITKQCNLREKVLRLLMSRPSEMERSGLDLSLLFDMMGPQAPAMHMPQQPLLSYYGQSILDAETRPSLISLSSELPFEKPFFIGDLGHGSEIPYDMYHPDDRVSLTSSGTETEDIFSTLYEICPSKNSIKWKKQQMLVPYFDRRARKSTRIDVTGSSAKQSVMSSEKVKNKSSSKKKSSVKAVKERDFYRNNLFHVCESLLSVMVGKNQHGRTAMLSLKRSGPELPKVLTQFSASIAGTGLAVLFSVVCKVACGRVPFCASKLLNTGLGIGLVWLSWAINKLRDTVISINKNSDGLDMKGDEIMNKLDNSVKEIYFRAAVLLALAVLRLA